MSLRCVCVYIYIYISNSDNSTSPLTLPNTVAFSCCVRLFWVQCPHQRQLLVAYRSNMQFMDYFSHDTLSIHSGHPLQFHTDSYFKHVSSKKLPHPKVAKNLHPYARCKPVAVQWRRTLKKRTRSHVACFTVLYVLYGVNLWIIHRKPQNNCKISWSCLHQHEFALNALSINTYIHTQVVQLSQQVGHGAPVCGWAAKNRSLGQMANDKRSHSIFNLIKGRIFADVSKKNSRWFKVTFWSPSWRSLSHVKGSLNIHLTILKRSLWFTRLPCFCLHNCHKLPLFKWTSLRLVRINHWQPGKIIPLGHSAWCLPSQLSATFSSLSLC